MRQMKKQWGFPLRAKEKGLMFTHLSPRDVFGFQMLEKGSFQILQNLSFCTFFVSHSKQGISFLIKCRFGSFIKHYTIDIFWKWSILEVRVALGGFIQEIWGYTKYDLGIFPTITVCLNPRKLRTSVQILEKFCHSAISAISFGRCAHFQKPLSHLNRSLPL